MIKFAFKIMNLFMLFSLMGGLAQAQTFFNFGNKTHATPASGTGATNQVMPSQDFKNMVDTLGKQNQESLSQQAKQMLKPTPPPATNQPAAGNLAQQPGPATNAANPSAPVASAPAPVQSTYPAQNSQPYTGFNFGNTNKPATGTVKNPTSNSGGWNIKY